MKIEDYVYGLICNSSCIFSDNSDGLLMNILNYDTNKENLILKLHKWPNFHNQNIPL